MGISFSPGTYRFDTLVLIAYQMNHFFGVQQLFTIFLEYTPPTACIGNHCFAVVDKCTRCPEWECPNLCANLTGHQLEVCVSQYSHTYFKSAALEFGYYCKTGLLLLNPTTAQYLGVLIGSLFVGLAADRFGRRLTVLVSVASGIIFISLSASFNHVALYYAFRILLGMSIAGALSVGWAYCSELVTPPYRFKLRTFSNWANGRLLMTFVCFLARDWRISSYILSGGSLVTFALFFYLPESPIWLKKKERYEEAEEARQQIAMINGIDFESEKEPTSSEIAAHPPKVTLRGVFEDPQLKTNILVLWSMWFTCSLVVYMIDLGGADMTNNLWIGQFLACLMLSVARILLGFADMFIPWLGRRLVYIAAMTIGLVAVITLTVLHYSNHKGETSYLIAYLSAFVILSLCWEPSYLAVTELIPTDVRATATASCNVWARIGALIASLVVMSKTLHEPVVFFVALLVGGASEVIVIRYLPETKNAELEKVDMLEATQESDETGTGTFTSSSISDAITRVSHRTITPETESKSIR